MPFLIDILVSGLIFFSFIQELQAQTKFACRQVVFNCDCGNPGYVFQASFKQCHYWLPPEQACTKFQYCLECENEVDKCVSCPQNRYGRLCRGLCRCKDGQTCNRDSGQCEGKAQVTPPPVSCIPPDIDSRVGQKQIRKGGILQAIEYSCPDYSIVNGAKRIVCNDGEWDNNPPECKATGCQRPDGVPNGRIEEFILPSGTRIGGQGSGATQVFPIGTTAIFRCNAYYKLVHRGQKTCQDTGKWNEEQPRCLIDCGVSEFSKVPTIFGGTVTQPGHWPWQAALANLTNYIFCGGSLITDNWVLTAAHCLEGRSNAVRAPSATYIFLGKYHRNIDDKNVQKRLASSFIIHQAYARNTLDSDIALIALSESVTLNSHTLPVCVTRESISHRNIEIGKSGVVTGWGRTETGKDADVLKQTSLSIISNTECANRHSKDINQTFIVTVNMFCAGVPGGASDICDGDSGGPMVFDYETDVGTRWFLEGIVSWGSNRGCAQDGLYSGFTKVVKFLFWLYTYVDDLP